MCHNVSMRILSLQKFEGVWYQTCAIQAVYTSESAKIRDENSMCNALR